MVRKPLLIVFWFLVGIFVFLICQLTIPGLRFLMRWFLFPIPFIVFFSLGIALIVLTLKGKVAGKLKALLLLTGSSAVGVFPFILLHNLVYGLFIFFFGENFWERTGLGDEPVFFILGLLVCPIAFLIGAIGSGLLFLKRK
jgi:hypothetical protein